MPTTTSLPHSTTYSPPSTRNMEATSISRLPVPATIATTPLLMKQCGVVSARYGKPWQVRTVIYTHAGDALFVNLYAASQLDWKDAASRYVRRRLSLILKTVLLLLRKAKAHSISWCAIRDGYIRANSRSV